MSYIMTPKYFSPRTCELSIPYSEQLCSCTALVSWDPLPCANNEGPFTEQSCKFELPPTLQSDFTLLLPSSMICTVLKLGYSPCVSLGGDMNNGGCSPFPVCHTYGVFHTLEGAILFSNIVVWSCFFIL